MPSGGKEIRDGGWDGAVAPLALFVAIECCTYVSLMRLFSLVRNFAFRSSILLLGLLVSSYSLAKTKQFHGTRKRHFAGKGLHDSS